MDALHRKNFLLFLQEHYKEFSNFSQKLRDCSVTLSL